MIEPLKYQKGGTAASQEQLVQLFQAAAENAQVDPQQLVQKASEIGQDEEAAAQFMQGLQLCAQGDPEGIEFIKSLFQSQAFRKGGKIFEFVCKHAKGGYVSGCGCGGNVKKEQDGGLVRAKAYYANHADEGIIRKLQNFLSARGYDLGEAGPDGKFGQKTYEAIKQYQRDNGLVDDGMWGEDTNLVHRVLGAGETTFNGPRSGARSGIHTYTNQFKGQKSYATPEQEDAYLRNITNRAYNDTNWFWGDSADANAARDFLYGRNGGNEFIQDIYENYTSPELQQRIAYSKLPVNIQQQRYNQGISDYVSDAGKTGAKVGAAIGGTMLAAEAIPYLIDAVPEMANGLKGVWNPAQARTGTFFNRIPNGSVTSNLNGQFVSNAGMNMGQFTSGTDYAATIANNLRMLKPYGFKNGGNIKKAQDGASEIGFPNNNYQIVRDTTYMNPANKRIMEQVIVGPDGQAYRRTTVNGANPIAIGGYWDGEFTPEGDSSIPVQRFDSLFRRAIPKVKNNQNVIKDQNPAGPMPDPSYFGTISSDPTTNPIRRRINNVINNNSTLRSIQTGFRNFGNSAMGRVLRFMMPNPNSEGGMLGAAVPVGKIKYIPQGVSGTEKAAKWVAEHTPETPHIVSIPPKKVDETEGAKIINGLREWLYGKSYNGR